MTAGWPSEAEELIALQHALAEQWQHVPRWQPPTERPLRVGGVFVATPRGQAGPRGRAAAVVLLGTRLLDTAVVTGELAAPYTPGLLALREGRLLAEAVGQLAEPPDVLLVNASGRGHPRRAGLALHVGAACDLPTIGVTDRPLVAVASAAQPRPEPGATTEPAPEPSAGSEPGPEPSAATEQPGPELVTAREPAPEPSAPTEPGPDGGAATEPGPERGAATELGPERGAAIELWLDGELVGYRLRTRAATRAIVVHAAWRVDAATAAAVVLAASYDGRTPTPLREARRLARSARAVSHAQP